jgi:tetratricopeptide (TPR) repeat protein
LVSQKRLPLFTTVFNRDRLWGLVGVVGSVVLIIFSVVTLYGLTVRTYGWWRYAGIMTALNQTGDSRAALADLLAVRSVHRNEVFDRLAVDLVNDQLKKLAANTTATADEQRVTFVALITQASKISEQSLADHSTNYANWLSHGALYETVTPFGVEGAAAAAERDYQQVIKLNPQSPIGYVALARTYLAAKQPTQAKVQLTKALAVSPNSVPTLLYLAQVETMQNDLKGAISLLEGSVIRLPFDPRLWLTLGYLRYSAEDYEGAIAALTRTISLDNNSAEAHYYLALSYDGAGESDLALAELRFLDSANPGNKELQQIIANVEAGRGALAGPVAPAVTKKK